MIGHKTNWVAKIVRHQPVICGREVTHPVPRPTIADDRNGKERIGMQFDTACGGAPELRVFQSGDRLYVQEWVLLQREAVLGHGHFSWEGSFGKE